MRALKKTVKRGCLVLIVSLAFVFAPSACKKQQPPSARDEAQNSSIQSAAPSQSRQEFAGDKIPLKILYVGLSNTERQEDFVSFLSKNFKEVKTVDLYVFKEEQTNGSDVVILDKDGIQWGSRGGRPLSDLRVSSQYSRPTVSLGIPGAFWTDRMRLKTGYM